MKGKLINIMAGTADRPDKGRALARLLWLKETINDSTNKVLSA